MHPLLSLLILISHVLIVYPLVGDCVNDTSFITSKSSYTPSESRSIIPAVGGNVAATHNISVLSSPKKTSTAEQTTKKYEAIKKMNQMKESKQDLTSESDSDVSVYRLNSTDEGKTCILMTVDALISITYKTILKETEEGDAFVPSNAKSSGECSDEEDKSSMLLEWKSYALEFNFAKTPGGERWFVNRVQLNFNTKESLFKHVNRPNVNVQATTVEGELLFPTPVGQSFKCNREIVITLLDPAYPDIKAKLLLRKLTVEPFLFKSNNFGQEYLCPAAGDGSFRSETAPFIFGSLLTIASLFTIAGYAIYRYLKVNKVQYDTME